MDLKPPPPGLEEAPTSARWIILALLGISLAFALSYIWRPWSGGEDPSMRYFREQILLNPSERISGDGRPIKLGLLHSRTGFMAVSENPMVEAELMAVEEINLAGGLLRHQVEAVMADGRSNPRVFAAEAERLISQEKVCTIIGCDSTASRLEVQRVVEHHGNLLIYPKLSGGFDPREGYELSSHTIYTGAAVNQQVMPAVKWSFDNLGRRLFFVGSYDPDAEESSEIPMVETVRHYLDLLGSGLDPELEAYIPVGTNNAPVIKLIVDRIKVQAGATNLWAGRPSRRPPPMEPGGGPPPPRGRPPRMGGPMRPAGPLVIFSAVQGESNLAFYQALRAAGVTNPVVSVSIGEDELRRLPPEQMAGNYAAASYFESLERPENREFVARFKARYGRNRVTSDAVETAYFSVKLWAQAVLERGSAVPKDIQRNLYDQSLDAPEGVVSIDRETQHTWRSVSVGRAETNGQFTVVWSTRAPIRPVLLPHVLSRDEWDTLQEQRRSAADEDYEMPFDEPEP